MPTILALGAAALAVLAMLMLVDGANSRANNPTLARL